MTQTALDQDRRELVALKLVAMMALHIVPLLLASTAFTLITAPLGYSPFTWSYATYSYQNGFGYTYHSDYSLAQVLTYLLAYGSGIVLYPWLTRPPLLSVLATLLCLAGAISFAIELSHWFSDHHLSLIASFPLLVLPVGIWTMIACCPRPRRPRPAM